jgi:hypothetical protein
MVKHLFIAGLVAAAVGCKPELEGRRSLVGGARVLAVRSMPASAKPSESVSYDALFVNADGIADPEPLDWALCIARKPLTESGAVSVECLAREASSLEALGTGAEANASVPADACALFGPTPQTPEAGEPAPRPVDPDTTGGFYQPVRVVFADDAGEDQYSIGVTRLACGLGGATQEQAAEFTRRSKPNENPQLETVAVLRGRGAEDALPALDSDDVFSVPSGVSIHLIARWPDCPTEPVCGDEICSPGEDTQTCDDDCRQPHGCRGSETYVYFDPITRKLRDRREAMRVSWFASDGEFSHDRTGQSELDAGQANSTNDWTAPAYEGDLRIWVVLRDDRGGVGWSSYKLRVE